MKLKIVLLIFFSYCLLGMETGIVDNNLKVITSDRQVCYIPFHMYGFFLTSKPYFSNGFAKISQVRPLELMDVSYQEMICIMPIIWHLASHLKEVMDKELESYLLNLYGSNGKSGITELKKLKNLAKKIGFLRLLSALDFTLSQIQDNYSEQELDLEKPAVVMKIEEGKSATSLEARPSRKKNRKRDGEYLNLSNKGSNLVFDFQPIEKFSALRGLSLSHNRLQCIPEALFLLANLRNLNLSHNLLSNVRSLERLNLKDLKLDYNRIQQFPIITSACSLDLRSNLIQEIPEEIEKLQSLKILYISRNPLVTISVNLLKLKNLIALSSQNTNLSDHSKEIVAGFSKKKKMDEKP